jgi:dienelactone hydrolase
MTKGITIILIITFYSVEFIYGQDLKVPDTIFVQSGNLTLKGLLWRPIGRGPFATIIFCHGNYTTDDTTHEPINEASALASLFVERGFIYFALFRRGVGLSEGQGLNSADLMENAFKLNGQDGRNEVQLQQLETSQMQDMHAGINYLKSRPDVDKHRMALIGHSFGSSLALLVAENDTVLKAVVIFSGSVRNWNLSPMLRSRLTSAVENINVPIMIIHAQNDYSTTPGTVLDSVLNRFHKPHILKIYPKFGNSANEAHNIIFLSPRIWRADVFTFLEENFKGQSILLTK